MLLPCVDEDGLRVLVECPSPVVKPVLVCTVLVPITDVVWVVSVVRTSVVVGVDPVEAMVVVWPVLIVWDDSDDPGTLLCTTLVVCPVVV